MPITEATRRTSINLYGNTKLAFEGRLRTTPRRTASGTRPCGISGASGAVTDGTIGEDHDPETHLIPLVLQVALEAAAHRDLRHRLPRRRTGRARLHPR